MSNDFIVKLNKNIYINADAPREEVTAALDMASGDQVIMPQLDFVISKATIEKPETLIPSNIRKDVNIGGVVGEIPEEAPWEEVTAALDMASGDQVVMPQSGYVMSKVAVVKPETLIPSNIRKDVNIGGVVGEIPEEAPREEITAALDMANGDQVVMPQSGYVMSKVAVEKPSTLIPSNIRKDVDIGGIVGNMDTSNDEWYSHFFWNDGMIANLYGGDGQYLEGNIPPNTIRLLVDTRYGLKDFGFFCSSSGGYILKIYTGNEPNRVNHYSMNYSNGAVSKYVFDESFSENIAVIEIVPQTNNAITDFKITRPNAYSFMQYPGILWAIINAPLVNNQYMFSNASTYVAFFLESCDLYGIKTFYAGNGCFSFANINNLESIKLPNTLTRLGGGVFTGAGIKKIVVPNSVIYMDTSVFADCSRIEKVIFETNKVTYLPYRLFENCKYLKEIELPQSMKSEGYSASRNCFTGCCSLQKIKLSSDLNEIPEAAFQYCYSLSEIEIPDTVKGIYQGAFSACRSLQKVKYNGVFSSSVNGATVFNNCFQLKKLDLRGCKWTAFSMSGCSLLGSEGNIEGTNVPVLIDYINSTFSGSSPQIDYSSCGMDAEQLNATFERLPILSGKTIKVSGNPGYSASDKTIATTKGWTVT